MLWKILSWNLSQPQRRTRVPGASEAEPRISLITHTFQPIQCTVAKIFLNYRQCISGAGEKCEQSAITTFSFFCPQEILLRTNCPTYSQYIWPWSQCWLSLPGHVTFSIVPQPDYTGEKVQRQGNFLTRAGLQSTSYPFPRCIQFDHHLKYTFSALPTNHSNEGYNCISLCGVPPMWHQQAMLPEHLTDLSYYTAQSLDLKQDQA